MRPIAAAGSGSRVVAVGDQLDRPEHALAAHLADRRRARSASSASAGPISVAPIARAFSTMPSDAIASSVATIEAIASGCPE